MFDVLGRDIIPSSTETRRSVYSFLVMFVVGACMLPIGLWAGALIFLVGFLEYANGLDRGCEIYQEAFVEVYGVKPREMAAIAICRMSENTAKQSRYES